MVEFLEFLIYNSMPFAIRGSLTSFVICIPLIFFSRLIGPLSILSTPLKRSEEGGQSHLSPDCFSGAASSFSLFWMMLAVGSSEIVFIMLWRIPSSPALSRIFMMKAH